MQILNRLAKRLRGDAAPGDATATATADAVERLCATPRGAALLEAIEAEAAAEVTTKRRDLAARRSTLVGDLSRVGAEHATRVATAEAALAAHDRAREDRARDVLHAWQECAAAEGIVRSEILRTEHELRDLLQRDLVVFIDETRAHEVMVLSSRNERWGRGPDGRPVLVETNDRAVAAAAAATREVLRTAELLLFAGLADDELAVRIADLRGRLPAAPSPVEEVAAS